MKHTYFASFPIRGILSILFILFNLSIWGQQEPRIIYSTLIGNIE